MTINDTNGHAGGFLMSKLSYGSLLFIIAESLFFAFSHGILFWVENMYSCFHN